MGIIIGILIVLFLVILAIVAILAIVVAITYNNLVTLRKKVENSWSQINIQLQRRFDLIPNLVETVKGYMNHEEETLTKIAELRASWADASTISEKADLDIELSNVLSRLIAISESYPDLKANQNFSELQEELRNTEDKISFSRQFYNDSVTMYNTKLELFPSNIIAGMFKFKPSDLFEVENEEVKNNIKIDFDK